MGLSQITAAKIAKGRLNLEKFETIGLLTTYSKDDLVTDSGAAATAIATGHKTYNGAIACDSKKNTLKTIFEYAKEKGKSTGLVVTCTITHATPAAFVAHVDDRNKHAEIAEQIAESDLDVMIGGGWAYFVPESFAESKRRDAKDLLAVMKKKQMQIALSIKELRETKNPKKLACFVAPVNLPKVKARDYSLAELTSRAISILSKNEKGFILMVEGSQIDWAAHDNNSDDIISEVIDFDDAVGIGLEYALYNKNTLVLVTADHETGGYAIHGGSIGARKVTASGFTTTDHTAVMVPLFAYGPGDKYFGGIQDNTIIGKRIIEFYSTF